MPMATDFAQGFALKFISGKYQGGEFPLRPEREVVIGRSGELDMVLVEEMVSRKHARIGCSQGRVTIHDLGSTNGTFVNGQKVQEARLKAGDRILIGTSILKLVPSDGQPSRLDSLQANRKLEAVAASHLQQSDALTGRLEELPLPDLLQMFATSKKNGVLTISGEHRGRVHLRQGRLIFAEVDSLSGASARKTLFRILTWEAGRFALDPLRSEVFPVELEGSTEALLMEGVRQMDELRRVRSQLPTGSGLLSLQQPLRAALRQLSADQLEVLQAAINGETVEAAIDACPLTDCETATALLYLLNAQYLTWS